MRDEAEDTIGDKAKQSRRQSPIHAVTRSHRPVGNTVADAVGDTEGDTVEDKVGNKGEAKPDP